MAAAFGMCLESEGVRAGMAVGRKVGMCERGEGSGDEGSSVKTHPDENNAATSSCSR